MVNEVVFLERACRLLALEADRRAHIARRTPGPDVDPAELVRLMARALALPLLQQRELVMTFVLERIPFMGDPEFDQNDYETMLFCVERLEGFAAGERERPALA